MVARLFFALAALLPAGARACTMCFSESKYHLGLIIGTLMLIPLPGLIAWALVRAARRAEAENRNQDSTLP